MEKSKLMSYAGQFLLVVAGGLTAIWLYDYLNKPKTTAPAVAATAAPTS